MLSSVGLLVVVLVGTASANFADLCKTPAKYIGSNIPPNLRTLDEPQWDDENRDCDYYLNLETTLVDPNVSGNLFGMTLAEASCDNPAVAAVLRFYAEEAGCCMNAKSKCPLPTGLVSCTAARGNRVLEITCPAGLE
eukprot:m.262080 g.262080  ORF g.262080 m.262080 type:complete len:137 (+) comp44338_c0_seq1:135-545(+)